jgi:anhydro-N-acetylmuramic acid kinase
MQSKWISAIGLMSGTSLDGLDIAFCRFKLTGDQWVWMLEGAETVSFEVELAARLKAAATISSAELYKLDNELGRWIGENTKNFINKHDFKPNLIASHGHTVFHQPEEGLSIQIGNLNAIYEMVNIPVINNFRQLDVLKGGQGAPLVPVGDALLFAEYDYCINLGGIANISFGDLSNNRQAFDISICNIGLNLLANELGHVYDKDGEVAQSGKVHSQLLEQLNTLSYYKAAGPKSLGIETLKEEVFPILLTSTLSVADKLATLTEHIACQIAEVLPKNSKNEGKLLVTGGGAFNNTLMNAIRNKLPKGLEIADTSKTTIEYKEAIIFAFLGVLRALHKVNVYASATGAQSDSVSGDLIGKVCI